MLDSTVSYDIIKHVESSGQPVPPTFIDDIAKCAYFGMHRARDICDYCGLTPLELLSCLIQKPDAVKFYKNKKAQLKLDLLKNVIDAANSGDDQSVSACKYLLGTLYKESEQAASIAQTKRANDMRSIMEKEKLKLSEKSLQFSKDSFLVSLVSKHDKQTIDKIKGMLQKYFTDKDY